MIKKIKEFMNHRKQKDWFSAYEILDDSFDSRIKCNGCQMEMEADQWNWHYNECYQLQEKIAAFKKNERYS